MTSLPSRRPRRLPAGLLIALPPPRFRRRPVASVTPADCPFCARIAAGEFDPHTADSYVVTFTPLNPVTPGHVLVVSRSHIISAADDPITAGMAMQKAAHLARNLR